MIASPSDQNFGYAPEALTRYSGSLKYVHLLYWLFGAIAIILCLLTKLALKCGYSLFRILAGAGCPKLYCLYVYYGRI